MRRRPHSALLPVITGILLATFLAVAALGPAPAHADDIEGAGNFEVSEDPALYKLRALDRIAPFEDLAPLWDHRDASLQANVEAALARLELDDDVALKHLAVVLVDVMYSGPYSTVVKVTAGCFRPASRTAEPS